MALLATSLAFAQTTNYSGPDANGIYTYTGEPVSAININFSTWAAGDLPATLSDDMVLQEVTKDGCTYGFVKWKLAWYDSGEVKQRVLFNNDNADFSTGPKNNATTNKPSIYFPTTVRGIQSISVTYVKVNNNGTESKHWFTPVYTDSEGLHDNVKSVSLLLPANQTAVLETETWTINSEGPTTLYLQHTGTTWPRIASIVFTLKPVDPTDIDNTDADTKVTKLIENGKLVIIKNGVRYNVLGSKF
ncbi:MAG: hypothetical protein J5704_03600 [Paludibacteraceae bacterium]|nr:hypothetical protein [Paludibacteraceae bacterium]